MQRIWLPIFFFILFIFSCYLMLHTFSYNSQTDQMLIASRLWSDFGAHIPLIRSFSKGDNWPPEYPLFPGKKIQYHFLFYAIVGLLEKSGVRLDWAMNIPSILGFFLLVTLIYYFAVYVFQRKMVGVLAVIFFLFNGTLSFLKFFAIHPLTSLPMTLNALVSITNFPSFGPWDGSIVTAFWNLNIYTNQRHDALAFALVLLALLLLLKHREQEIQLPHHPRSFKGFIKNIFQTIFLFPIKKTDIALGFLVGIIAGSLFFLHQPALFILVLFCFYLFTSKKNTRVPLLLSGLIALPFLFLFFAIAAPGATPVVEFGYLSAKPFAWNTFMLFWIYNLGLHIVLIPLGMLFAPKQIRFLAIPLVLLFIFPNLFRFSVDMINNHKFFSFFIIIGGMYTAFALVRLWDLSKVQGLTSKVLNPKSKFLNPKFLILLRTVPFIFFTSIFLLLTLSGIIDFFVINNDYYLVIQDLPKNADAQFIYTHIPPRDVILNSTWFYNPASLAGRSIYSGYSFFTWSAGYDTYGREAITKQIYRSSNLQEICELLHNEHIAYVQLNRQPETFLQPISPIWTTLPSIYQNPISGVTLYETNLICF